MARNGRPGLGAPPAGGGGRRAADLARALAVLAAVALVAASAAHAAPWAGDPEAAPPGPAAWPPRPHPITALLPAAHAEHDLGACVHTTSHQTYASYLPRVSSISFTSPNGIYFAGDTVDIRVDVSDRFELNPQDNANAQLSHTQLALETGATDRLAVYDPDSPPLGNSYVLYNYTVQPGDFSTDLDYNSTVALRWGGYWISGTGGALIVCELPAPGASGSLAARGDISVLGIAPPYARFVTPAGTYGAGDTVTVAVKLAEAAEYRDAASPPSLALNVSGAQREALFWKGNGTDTLLFNYTVGYGDNTGDLGYHGTGALSGSLVNRTGQDVNQTLPSTDTLAFSKANVVLATPDGVASVSSPNASAVYGSGSVIRVNVTFTGPVTVSGSPRIELETGATDRNATYVPGLSGGASLLFEHTVGPGDASVLGWTGPRALSLNGATIVGFGGAAADLTLPGPAGGAPLAAAGGGPILVDHAAPVLVATGSASPGGSASSTVVVALEAGGSRYVLSGHTGLRLSPVNDDGTLGTAAGSLSDGAQPGGGTAYLGQIEGADSFMIGDDTYAIAAASADNALQLVRVHGNGSLELGASLRGGALELDGVRDVAAFEMGGAAYALSVAVGDDGVQMVRVRGDGGGLDAVDSLDSTADFGGMLRDPISVDTFRLENGSVRALVTSLASDAVHLLGVDEDGLRPIGDARRGSPGFGSLDGPYLVASIGLDGGQHALVSTKNDFGSNAADRLHLLSVSDDGVLREEALALDNSPGFAALQEGRGIAVVGRDGASGWAYAAMTANGDNGVQLAAATAGGALLPAGNIFGTSSRAPYIDLYGIDTFDLGGRSYAAVGSSNGHVTLLRLSPTSVTGVGSTAYDGAHFEGRQINVTVDFDGPVASRGGPPALLLDVGGIPRNATYLSGNATSSLVFNYTVRAADRDDDLGYMAVDSLSGDIRDVQGGLRADTTLPAPGGPRSLSGSSNIALDSSAPRVQSVSSAGGPGPHGIGSMIDVDVVFDAPVVVDAAGGRPALPLDAGGAAEYLSGSPGTALVFRYAVADGDQTGSLDHVGSHISLNGGAIAAQQGGGAAALALPAPTGTLRADRAAIAVDGVRPEVVSVSSPNGTGPHGPGRQIHVNVTFDKQVSVDTTLGSPTLELHTAGAANRSAAYDPGLSGGASLVFVYAVVQGDVSADLDYTGTSALSLNGGTIRDGIGNGANPALPARGGAGSLAYTSDVEIDAAPPSVDGVSAPGGTGVHGLGDTVRIRVGFDKAVNVTGAPHLLLNTGSAGGANRSAIYESGSGTQNLVFSYEVRAGDYSGDLAYAGAGALTGTVFDSRTGLAADLDLPDPGGGAPLSAAGSVLVDHAAPVLIRMGSAVNGTGGFDGLDSADRVSAVKAGGAQYLVVTSIPSYAPDAVQLIRVHENGTMEAADSARNGTGGFDTLTSLGGIKAFTMNGTAWAIVTSSHPSLPEPAVGNEGVQLIRVNGSGGTLEAADSLNKADDAGLLFESAFRVDVVEAGVGDGRATYALVTSNDFTGSRGVQTVRVHGSGTLEAAGSVESAASGGSLANFAFPYDVDAFRLENGSARALVTDYTNDTLHLFAVNRTGGLEALSHAKHAAGGFRLHNPDSVASFAQAGERRALVGGETDYLQLVRVNDDSGAIAPASSAVEDGGPEGFDALDKVRGLAVFGVGRGSGGTYSVSTAENENSVQLARVGAGGALLPAGSIVAPAGRLAQAGLLSDPQGVDTFELGGRTYAAVASLSGDSVTLIRLTLASVESVSSPNATGAHAAGAPILVNVTFSEPVAFADGAPAPALLLDIGGGPQRNATYADGNGTSSLVFVYNVTQGDNDMALGYAGTAALSGDVRDLDGHPADTTLPPPGPGGRLPGSSPVVLDAYPPRVLSVSSPNRTGTYGIGSLVAINVTFGEAVYVEGGTPSATVRPGDGTAARSAPYMSGSGTPSLLFNYTVRQGDGMAALGRGIVTALSAAGGATIRDMAGNDAVLDLPDLAGPLRGDGAAIRVDGTRPRAESVSSPDRPGLYGIGGTVRIDVNFSMPVAVEDGGGRPFLALAGGLGAAGYASAIGEKTLRFEYAVQEGDTAPRLDYAGRSALVLNGSTIRDAAGNDAGLGLPAPDGSLLDGESFIRVDGVRPEAESVSSPNGTGTYYTNQRVHINVGFTEDVTVVHGERPPSIALSAGSDGARASYVSGSGTDTLAFAYDVRHGEPASALDYAGGAALDLGGGSVRDAAGNDARPGLPPHGTPGSRVAAAGISVDGTVVSVEAVTSPDADGAYAAGARVNITVRFFEAVDVSPGAPPPSIALNAGDGARASYVSGGGGAELAFEYEVRPGDNTGRLAYDGGSALSPGGASITASDGGAPAHLDLPFPGLPSSLSGSRAIEIDTVPPAVARVHSPNRTGAYGIGATIHVVAEFGESVTVAGAPLVPLDTGGGKTGAAAYASGSGTSSLLFLYAVAPGDFSADLDYAPGSSIILPDGASIRDAAGNAADAALPAPGGGSSLGDTAAVSVVGVAEPLDAAASAVFAGPNTVRIDYTAPLGPPEGHAGPAYGGVATAGGGGAAAPAVAESGLGTRTHTVTFGGDGVGAGQAGTIRLLVGLEGMEGGVIPYRFAAGDIPVRPGEEARTLSPPGAVAPVAAIEPGGFVRALNATAAGDGARPAINVTGLAAGGAAPETVFPPGGARIIASFAEVWIPPGATATGVPADGLIELYVSARAPTAQEVADGFGIDEADVLEVRRAVEAGDNATRIVFSLPVRILLAGQANGSAFYVGAADGAPVSPIRAECGADDTDAVHEQLGGSGACRIESGGDMAVYTYHLTRFGTARLAEFAGAASSCAAVLPEREVSLGSVEAGGQSAVVAQAVMRAGALPLAAVSVSADGAWTGADGGTVMPANATSVMAGGGAWTPLGGGASVALRVDDAGRSAAAEFRVDAPRGALAEGATDAVVSQAITYTVSCAAPPG